MWILNPKTERGSTAVVNCTASERSWQTAFLSSVPLLLFFSWSSWLREKSQIPAELEMDAQVPRLFDFSAALQSHPGRRIVKEAGPSHSQITCNGQLQIFHFNSLPLSLWISLSLSLPCVVKYSSVFLFFFFLSSSFVFTLTFTRSEQASAQFRLLPFLNKRRRDERSGRKGSCYSVQNYDQVVFFFWSSLQSTSKVTQWVHSEALWIDSSLIKANV